MRRRHLITRKGREVIGLDDEVFDQVAVEDEGLPVAGEGALLAALERNRTGRMGDIVATIQAEQDEAIRADVHGVLVVAGGPGTGKTAVALHRAAYLLYTHRRRLATQGVLLIGPSPVFLRYIEQVLPSLGEQDVQLSTIAGPEAAAARARRPTRAHVAALKGDARMARVIERAVADRERPLARRPHRAASTGCACACRARDTARVDRGHAAPARHAQREPAATSRAGFFDLLVARYKNAAIRAYRERSGDAPRRQRHEHLRPRLRARRHDREHARARRSAARRLGAGAARALPRAGPR